MNLNADAEQVRAEIQSVCKGWSNRAHWFFWENFLGQVDPSRFPVSAGDQDRNAINQAITIKQLKDICLMGIYQGRDTAFVSAIAKRMGRSDVRITAVDKFQDGPCED